MPDADPQNDSTERHIAYGCRLPNAVIDERAASGDTKPCVLIPKSKSVQDGFRQISFSLLANAINRCACWLKETTRAASGDTIAYVGPTDLRYLILAWAAVKTGHIMFFPSPRNPPEVQKQLLENADAKIYLCASEPSETTRKALQQQCSGICVVPSLDELLDDEQVDLFPYETSYDQYRYRPFVKLHTSGSTGLPKIVPIKHGLITALDAYYLLEYNENALRYGGQRVLAPFPLFHIAGLLQTINVMLWTEGTVVMLPAGVPVTAELVHNAIQTADIEHCQLTPSTISELVQNPIWRSGLGNLKGLTFAGGPLSEEIAGIVTQHTKIYSTVGTTEYGANPMLQKSDEDWKYFRFHAEAAGMFFEEIDQPGLYEMVYHRSENAVSKLIQGIFITYPELDEYHTKDCFSKHPTKPGLWKYETRLDDILVLSNGENVSTVPMEGSIGSCPAVKGCLVLGQGKFQTALLVEKRDSTLSDSEVSKVLQPFLDKANEACPTYARIAYDKLIYTSSEKPLPRAGKGTIQRGLATRLYRDEIEECYSRASRLVNPTSRTRVNIGDPATTETSILAYLGKMLTIDKEDDLLASDDFFARGMDSLQVISFVQEINHGRAKEHEQVNPAFIYNHPTAEKLALALASNKRVKEYSDFDDDDDETKETWLRMEQMFQASRSKDMNEKPGNHFSLTGLIRSDDPAPIYQPDSGTRAWLQVFGSFLINTGNWGLVNSFGIFQTYYAADLLRDHSSSDISWIGTVQGSLLLIVGVISGPIFDKGYFRAIQVVGGLGLVFGIMMLSLATEYYQVMLSQGILLGICSGLLYVPSVALIPLYFKRYRGLALGLATVGGPLGGVLYPIIFRRLLDSVGFGWATRVIGFVTLATLSIALALIKPLGPRSTRKLFELGAFMDVPYITFAFTAFFTFAGFLVPYFLASDFASSELRMSSDLSFYVLAILNGAQFFGRIIPAILSDWVGPEVILLAVNCLTGVVGFCWIAVGDSAGYIIWLVFYGLISGMCTVLPSIVLPYICPSLAVIGTRLGMLYAIAGLGFLISTPVALTLLQDANGFLGAQCWVGACMLCATLFFIVTAREARQRRKLYEDHGQGSHKLYILRKA